MPEILTVPTASGSTYEVDTEQKLVRRLSNSSGSLPTQRFDSDGVWQPYVEIGTLSFGHGRFSMLISWPQEFGEDRRKDFTETSVVQGWLFADFVEKVCLNVV